ncbi:MAG TPA: 2,3-bisphosphoglycerate-independent phosphoglycerate mutase [Luteibaculaceae bacterium]|nr:2,3-bisphosphoglycerate-independent phosphoglycerate mutase [Luteibaculaceae bacterium]
MNPSKVALIILDGWGIGKKDKSDAIFQASTPFMDAMLATQPHAALRTDGEHVGLPAGQMGNSEVGHLNIGAGRIVYQDLAKINVAIESGELAANSSLKEAFQKSIDNQRTLHLMGLVSDGGVHSHVDHLIALCDLAERAGVSQICIHAFTDGRDTDPKSGKGYLNYLRQGLTGKRAQLGSVIGRYYAMDRDKRWERIAQAYHLLTAGVGERFEQTDALFDHYYQQNITDEFIPASKLPSFQPIVEGDVVLCFNFRTDRCREITEALTQRDFPEHDMKKLALEYYTLTNYDKTFERVRVVFDKDNLELTLGEVLALKHKTQVRMAETEKYPHVTFFFSGGREQPFEGERRIMVHSPKVATYDLQPEMSAPEIAERACGDLQEHQPDFLCLNFANPDMVGHTGVFGAIVKAVETTDRCCQQVAECALSLGYRVLIIADHGNADLALNDDGTPNTAHSTHPVPVVLLGEPKKTLSNGILADVAPTVLDLMGLDKPAAMTGRSLLQ